MWDFMMLFVAVLGGSWLGAWALYVVVASAAAVGVDS